MSPYHLRNIRHLIQKADNIPDAIKVLDKMIEETEKTFVCQIVWQMEDIEHAIEEHELQGKVDADDVAHDLAKVLQDQSISLGWDMIHDEIYSRKE